MDETKFGMIMQSRNASTKEVKKAREQIDSQRDIRLDLLRAADEYIKQEPYIGEDGIYEPMRDYVPKGCASTYRMLISKEMFIAAYKKWIEDKE